MSQFSPDALRVGLLTTSVADDIWLERLKDSWSAEEVRFGRVKEAASPDIFHPELLLLVLGNVPPDAEEAESVALVAKTAREQGALVLGVVAGPDQTKGSCSIWWDALHGLVEVGSPATLATALSSLLRLILTPGVIRLEKEDIEDFFRMSPRCRLTVGQGEGPNRIEEAMAGAMQEQNKTILLAPKGHWLVGIMSDASLSSVEFNAAGKWLQGRVPSGHEITVMASSDVEQNDMCRVMLMASC